MKVTVNGESRPVSVGTTLLSVVSEITARNLDASGQPADGGRLGVAVAYNQDIARRSEWNAQVLNDGDEIEVVTAVQGG